MQNNNEFAALLKHARKSAQFSQAEVSEKLMLVRSTYGHFEQGVRTPSPEFILQISALYNLNPIPFLLSFSSEEMRIANPSYYKKLSQIGNISMDATPSILSTPIHRRKRLRNKNASMN